LNFVGDFLLSIIVRSFNGCFICCYIIIRCILQPSIAPQYEVERIPFRVKLILTVKYLLPLSLVIVSVIGLIVLGVATPTEAAATGAVVCFILAFCYKGFRGDILKKSIVNSVKITVMMFMILSAAQAFSQLLAYTGASSNLVMIATKSITPHGPVHPDAVYPGDIGYLHGTSIDVDGALPIYMPIIRRLGINPLVLCRPSHQYGDVTISPPDGLVLYTMKAVAPQYSMTDIYKDSIPL
jgi:TRAP-type mannitol/chloroaromatic compound transport system permease large subunit